MLAIINAKKRHRAAVWPCAVRAQQASKSARVGWLTAQRAASLTPFVDAFRMSLADLGYVEGRTLEIAFRYGDDVVERVPELAAELIHLPVDLIVAQGAAVSVLSKLNLPVPIVYVTSGDPVVAGFAESLARPHGNMTGLTFMLADFSAPFKQIPVTGRLAGYAGSPNQKAAEVQTKYIIVDMYAKAIQGMPPADAVKAAHGELVKIYA